MNVAWWLVAALNAANLVPNSDFAQVAAGLPAGWAKPWARDGGAKIAWSLVPDGHDGAKAVKVVHTGEHDWALQAPVTPPTQPGDLFDLTVWVLVRDGGHAVLCGMLLPEKGDVGAQWAAGGVVARGPQTAWRQLKTRIVVPPGLPRFTPRLIGDGPVEVLVAGFEVRPAGNLETLRAAYQGPARLPLTAGSLQVELAAPDLAWTVTDRRTGRVWRCGATDGLLASTAEAAGGEIHIAARSVMGEQEVRVGIGPGR